MSTTTTKTAHGTYQLQLRTLDGNVVRAVSTEAPRLATAEEIPVIDIVRLYGDLAARKELAVEVKAAVETYGFFYIKNHGIPEEVIENASKQARIFFCQSRDKKEAASTAHSKFFNGWFDVHSRKTNPGEKADNKEAFFYRYQPENDPEKKDPVAIPKGVKPYIRGENYIWEATAHLPGFKEAIITYWKNCLTLSRRLIRIFSLVLDLPEDYFDNVVTYPGADAVLNFYPGLPPSEIEEGAEIGIGSHTDLQCFTLLWQDMIGGLQVLDVDGRWIKAVPIPGTIVVNTADFLTRLSNGKFKSTVHRVFNQSEQDRISMPFFFGFNPDEILSVVPTCIDEDHPAKYEPISCGQYMMRRFAASRPDN
ncbi:hypothetical protein SEUCBS139899_009720 [Sporothrix eucalyptigena]|uniref:Fe2OG dioxygenase domain-containing protein n=1 Tax=Sporothrix eucalyptigena TaxID=1812306 RepID=A0ABP0B363_9PEZI